MTPVPTSRKPRPDVDVAERTFSKGNPAKDPFPRPEETDNIQVNHRRQRVSAYQSPFAAAKKRWQNTDGPDGQDTQLEEACVGQSPIVTCRNPLQFMEEIFEHCR